MKNICLINGSLRGKKASSLVFLNYIDGMLGDTEFSGPHASLEQAEGDPELRHAAADALEAQIGLGEAVPFGIGHS